MAITSTQQTEILKIVSGLFNAAPGGTYLTELANLVQGGMTTSQLADALAAHSLFTGTIMAGKVTTASQVNVLMKNFGLTADSDPASAGSQAQAYFTQQIDANVGFGKIVYDAVQFLSGSVSPEFTTAATLLSNKALVAAAYSESNSSTSLTTLQNVLSSVTGTAAYTNADVTAILDTIGGGANVGQTFTLTTSADSGSAFTGSSGNDTFIGAYIGDAGTGTTFNPGDALNGGTGTDTLNVSVSGTITTGAAETISAFTLTGIEKVLVSNFDTQETAAGDDHVFVMSGATGVTTVGMSSSSTTGDTTFNNLRDIVSAEMKNGGGDLSVQYVSTLLTGSSDGVNLAVDGVGTSSASADFETYAVTTTGVAETLNITSSNNASFVTINANNDHATINVSGGANLSITNTLDTTVTKVDAGTATGALTITAGASNIAVTGGAGNDVINIVATLTTADTLDGGAGTDTLSITDPSTLVANLKVSNFETLRLAATSATAYDVSFVSGITTVDFRSNGNAAITSTNVAEGTGVEISADNSNTITHGVLNATNAGTTNTVTVTVDNSTDNTDTDIGTLSLSGIETINLVSKGVASTDTTANVFAGDVATSNSIATLTAAAATKINISGSSDLVLAATGSTVTANTAVDASTMTGRLVYTNRSTATAATTITGGTNDDFITGRNGIDSIVGGGGNDSLTGGGGNDTISGDAGNDTITTTGGNDSVLGGDGNDTINSGGGNDSINAGAGDDSVVINTSAAFTDDLTQNDTLAGGDGTDSLVFSNVGSTTLNFTTAAGQNAVSNVTGFERIDLGAGAAQTITINDLTATAFGGNLTIRATTDQAHVVSASGVLGSTNTVNFTTSVTTTTNAFSYTVGNAKDNVNMGTRAVNDTIIVGNVAFLSSNDTITGGGGTGDVLRFTDTTGATYSTATANNALTNVTGVESINVTTGGAGNYSFTLNDAFVAANLNSDSRVTVQTTDGSGTLVVNASDFSASYGLIGAQASSGAATLTGGAGNDSLTGGAAVDSLTGNAGNDTISGGAGSDVISGGEGNDSITGGNGADVITGGAGNDSIVFGSATQVGNEITDFNAGTSASTGVVDVLQFDVTGSGETGAFASAAVATALITIAAGDPTNTAASASVSIQTITSATADGTVLTAGTNILVFDATTGITSASALQTALQTTGSYTLGTGTATGAGTIDGYLIALYDKGSDVGIAIIDLAAAAGVGAQTTNSSTATEIVTLTGVSSLANIDASDFAFI